MKFVVAWVLPVLVCLAHAAEKSLEPAAVVQEDIVIRGKGPTGPPIKPPPPPNPKAVADEVLRSLDLYRSEDAAPQTQHPVSSVSRRLTKPFPLPPYLIFFTRSFPRPYDRWSFEVLDGEEVIYRSEGRGTAGALSTRVKQGEFWIGSHRESSQERLGWDGTDGAGKLIAKVARSYVLRFTGYKGSNEYTLTSIPIELTSLSTAQGTATLRLEVSNSQLFTKDGATFSEDALPYLQEMGIRLRRYSPRGELYRLTLYQQNPKAALSRARAERLIRYFSEELIVSKSKIAVDLKPWGERGDVTTCVVAADTSDSAGR